MARIIPGPAESSKIYRLQVGSYKLPRNAVDAFERLKSAGLEPAYEQYGEMYRVVLVGVRGNDIQSMASTLGRAGFSEVLIREER
jgi:rare lipoprotein A